MIIRPNWPLPDRVCAFVTTRAGGESAAPFDSCNLATHVGDVIERVESNRQTLGHALEGAFGQTPAVQWLNQTHSIRCAQCDTARGVVDADASYTSTPGIACAVLTADCLPVLLCSLDGHEVAAVHAGWRGLTEGVLQASIEAFFTEPEHITAYIGPAISMSCFQVGEELIEDFKIVAHTRGYAHQLHEAYAIDQSSNGKFILNLAQVARFELQQMGVIQVFGGDLCTFMDPRFYSYRQSQQTGRFASGIWIKK